MDKMLYYPGDDLYSRLVFVEYADKLKKLYTQIGQPEGYQKMTVEKYFGEKILVSEVVAMIEKEMSQYTTSSGGLAYSKDCIYECSSFLASGKYITLGLQYAGIDRQKVYTYYKKHLEERKERGW